MYEIQNLYLEHISKDKLKEYLEIMYNNNLIGFYAFILHDKDTLEDSEELKKPHFHLYIEWLEPCERITKRIVKCFNLFDDFVKCKIRVKYVYNNKKAIRYLTHKDDLEKYQYTDDDVITNDLQLYKDNIKLNNIKVTSKTQLLLNSYLEDVQKEKINNPSDVRDWFVAKQEILFYMQHTKGLLDLLYSYNPSCRTIHNDVYSINVINYDDKGNPITDKDLPF